MRSYRRTSNWLLLASLAVLSLGAASGCKQAPAEAPVGAAESVKRQPGEMEKFFVEWLQHHGEKSVVADNRGVGIQGNPLRLRAAVYEVTKHPQGGVSVELEFRIALPTGDEIVEYLAGVGKSEEQGTADGLANFVLTTFHPVYRAFLNPEDPHQTVLKISTGGREREMIQGDFFTRGEKGGGEEGLNAMAARIREVVSHRRFDSRPHWIKVVYAQNQKQPMTVSVTLDNEENPELTAKVKALPWPVLEQFYLSKQFLIIK